MKRTAFAMGAVLVFFSCSKIVSAGDLPIRFPFHIQPEISREDFAKLTNKKRIRVEKVPNPDMIEEIWPIWGDIEYKKFHPQRLKAIFDAGKLVGIDLIQITKSPPDGCTDTVQAYEDAIAFVEETYAYASTAPASPEQLKGCDYPQPSDARWTSETMGPAYVPGWSINLHSYYIPEVGKYYISLDYDNEAHRFAFIEREKKRNEEQQQKDNEQYEKIKSNL